MLETIPHPLGKYIKYQVMLFGGINMKLEKGEYFRGKEERGKIKEN
jgi:hypothetical protein